MQKYIAVIFALLLSALTCSGQSFLAKYPKLTKKTLPEFFKDWKAYSDSVRDTNKCNTDICYVVNTAEVGLTSPIVRALEGDLSHYVKKPPVKKYGIIPQYIPVEYYPIAPTPNDTLFFSWDYASLYDSILVKDTITPLLGNNQLYLTNNISTRLMEFITGLNVDNERPGRFINKNIRALQKHLRSYNDEHMGWVNFNDYPYIWKVQATDDFIVLHIKASNYTGYEQWYIKKEEGFEEVPGIHNAWIE